MYETFELLARLFEIEARLQRHPELLRRSEVMSQPKCSIGRDRTLAKDDLINAPRWHANRDNELTFAISLVPSVAGHDFVFGELPSKWVKEKYHRALVLANSPKVDVAVRAAAPDVAINGHAGLGVIS